MLKKIQILRFFNRNMTYLNKRDSPSTAVGTPLPSMQGTEFVQVVQKQRNRAHFLAALYIP
ncbi:hypothetical protein B0I21_105180 [Sphingobacterium paludis]|uniref:Uncharacterized protein n=1 Tax=Sphingobacterium paludis TaxID=1476465 RepID=A0A4V3E1K0_9SPHI|nr:hypothetical protein B0I21_105180 [Sphingobacterium paludis]